MRRKMSRLSRGDDKSDIKLTPITVIGMITTFQAITLFGTGDPKTMAGGISQALVTTVLGLVVAIPTTLLHAIVAARSRSVVHILEEQTAGIIADHAEKSGQALG